MFLIILAVFAVYRLSYLFYKEDGPYNLISNFKNFIIDQWGFEKLDHYKQPQKFFVATMQTIGDALDCPYCLGIWMSLFVWIIMQFESLTFIIIIFGIAGGQHIIERTFQNVEDR